MTIRILCSDDPTRRIWLGDDDQVIEITDSCRRAVIDMTLEGTIVTLDLVAEVDEIDWPVSIVQVAPAGLEAVTVDELNQVAATGGYGQGPGKAILEHLRSRGIVGR